MLTSGAVPVQSETKMLDRRLVVLSPPPRVDNVSTGSGH